MASVSTDKTGNRRIKFYDLNGMQRGIRIGKVDRKTADRLCRDIEELLAARRVGQPVHRLTADSLNRLDMSLRRRFEKVGLLEPLEGESPVMPLGAFLTAYVAGRGDLKPSTRDNLQQAVTALNEYFGAERPLDGPVRHPAPPEGVYADDTPRDAFGLTFTERRAATRLQGWQRIARVIPRSTCTR